MDTLTFAKQLDRYPKVRSRDWIAPNATCCPVLVSSTDRAAGEPAARISSRRVGFEPEYPAESRTSATVDVAAGSRSRLPASSPAAAMLHAPVKEFWSGLNGILAHLVPAAADRRGAVESLEEAHFALVEASNYEDAETLCALIAASSAPSALLAADAQH